MSDPAGAAARIELQVIGAQYGASGYTTVTEADGLGRRLGLGPGVRLLELGSGHGWPGIHLAATTGCDVVLTDVPLDKLRVAARAGRAQRCAVVAASGAELPFVAGSFDAVVHADVLC